MASDAEELASGIRVVMNATDVSGLRRLTGGASRETWRFNADGEDFVLQRVRKGTPGGLRTEPAVLASARISGGWFS